MADLSHSTNRDRFTPKKPGWLSFPPLWRVEQINPEQNQTTGEVLREDQPLPSSRRLLVILPGGDISFSTLPKRIWNLASPECRQVLLMVKPSREEDEYRAHMDLFNMAAMIRDPLVAVETQLVLEKSIEKAVCQCVEPEDVIICFEDHQTGSILNKRPLAEILAQRTHRPVYTLKGTVAAKSYQTTTRLRDITVMALCLVSLIAFLALEVWINQNSTGTLRTLSQILVLIAAIWVIGSLASKSYPT